MDDLKPQPLKKPMDKLQMGGDVAALNALLKLMNDPRVTGAEVPKGAQVSAEVLDKNGATMMTADPVITTKPVKAIPSDNPAIAAENAKYPGISHGLDSHPLQYKSPIPTATPRNTQKIFYTGLIGAGKDYIAEQTGATIYGFADPLYHLAEYFFGISVNNKQGKDIPGVRQFLQAAGQWGRAEVSEQYPLTAARACFISMVRSLGELGRFDKTYEIDWSKFGSDAYLWVNGVVKRATEYIEANPNRRVATTNVRFQPEFKALSGLGWTHYHVMCSPATRQSRVKVLSDKDTSEAMANALNNDVMKRISSQPTGSKLRAIWNDTAPRPSSRLYTVDEYLQIINTAPATAVESVVTGE